MSTKEDKLTVQNCPNEKLVTTRVDIVGKNVYHVDAGVRRDNSVIINSTWVRPIHSHNIIWLDIDSKDCRVAPPSLRAADQVDADVLAREALLGSVRDLFVIRLLASAMECIERDLRKFESISKVIFKHICVYRPSVDQHGCGVILSTGFHKYLILGQG